MTDHREEHDRGKDLKGENEADSPSLSGTCGERSKEEASPFSGRGYQGCDRSIEEEQHRSKGGPPEDDEAQTSHRRQSQQDGLPADAPSIRGTEPRQ